VFRNNVHHSFGSIRLKREFEGDNRKIEKFELFEMSKSTRSTSSKRAAKGNSSDYRVGGEGVSEGSGRPAAKVARRGESLDEITVATRRYTREDVLRIIGTPQLSTTQAAMFRVLKDPGRTGRLEKLLTMSAGISLNPTNEGGGDDFVKDQLVAQAGVELDVGCAGFQALVAVPVPEAVEDSLPLTGFLDGADAIFVMCVFTRFRMPDSWLVWIPILRRLCWSILRVCCPNCLACSLERL